MLIVQLCAGDLVVSGLDRAHVLSIEQMRDRFVAVDID